MIAGDFMTLGLARAGGTSFIITYGMGVPPIKVGGGTGSKATFRRRSKRNRERDEELIKNNWFTENWVIEVSGVDIYSKMETSVDTKQNVLVKFVNSDITKRLEEQHLEVLIDNVRVNGE